MSEIDDNIISTAKKTRKRPLLMVAAAAAAVAATASLAIMVVASVVSKNYIAVNENRVMDLNITVRKDVNTDPYEQFLEIDPKTRKWDHSDSYVLTARPSEVFEILNIHTLVNDNFTDEATVFRVDFSEGHVEVQCDLTDKKTGVNLWVTILGFLSEDAVFSGHHFEQEYELLDLNDGSKAFVYEMFGSTLPESWSGSFCYDGFYYSFTTLFTNYDNLMQTLDDFGIL